MQDSCPIINTDNCTVDTCPLSCAQVEYLPDVAGNCIFTGLFGLLLVAQIGLGIRYKTWGFLIGMVCGFVLEIVGYVGRIMLHDNPFDFNNFIIYLVPLTIAPAFLTGALYLCLSRIIIAHGQHISRFSPRTYSIFFMSCDFISLVLQGAGGGLAATANNNSDSDTGRNIMIAGVVFQVVSLLLFMGLWLEFIFRLRKTDESSKDMRFIDLRATKRFHWFQYAAWVAVILIFIRSVYRVAELQEGFHGSIANNEPLFMVLEGPMIILAVAAVTLVHPGFAYAGKWADAAWSLKGSRKAISGSASFEETEMINRKSRS